jgi:hypothetical protein
MKENGCVVVFFEDFSHFPMEITTLGLHAPCVLNPVYLSTQSDPHKSGSSQCQLNFGTKMVLIG